MKLTLCTLALNEMQWLGKLYEQHKDFPNLLNWVFVESADRVYAETNPSLVNQHGLSVDGTSEYLEDLSNFDNRVIYIQHGFSKHPDPAQGKIESRNRYLNIIHQQKHKPDFILVIDADEFWPNQAQNALEEWLSSDHRKNAFSFKHREIWHPPYNQQNNIPIFSQEVVKGFWDIPYCRGWRYIEGMLYLDNHNTPSDVRTKVQLTHKLKDHRRYRWLAGEMGYKYQAIIPEFVHMGFAADYTHRKAKNEYYKARGEGHTDKRGWYVESRAAWETWTPGVSLPRGAEVIPYIGPIPECFQ